MLDRKTEGFFEMQTIRVPRAPQFTTFGTIWNYVKYGGKILTSIPGSGVDVPNATNFSFG